MSTTMIKTMRTMGAALALASLQACASGSGGGTIGDILGSVLGGGAGGGSQVSGTIQGVDTRYRTIGLTQSNGSTVSINYDDNTKVVYNNQSYGVTSLERGDQVTARVQASNNNSYYTDLVQVDRPVQGSGGTVGGVSDNVVSIQGTVRGVDQSNGLFALDATNGTRITVSLPYNVTRNDQTRFQNLRNGDTVRFYGVYLNNSRVELRQFY